MDTCKNGERRINAEWTEKTTHGGDVSRRPGTLLVCFTQKWVRDRTWDLCVLDSGGLFRIRPYASMG